MTSELRGGLASAVLLDSQGGGTGTTFDWAVGSEVQAKAPFILAGGLTPANVASAVTQVRPWCGCFMPLHAVTCRDMPLPTDAT